MEELSFIKWLGHASFSFVDQQSGNRIYYIDPFDLNPPAGGTQNLQKADLIFVTHAHYDHCSFEDMKKIVKDDTVFIAPPDSLEKVDLPNEKHPVEPNKSYGVKGFSFKTIPAYNTHPDRLQAHPRSNNWVGYIMFVDGKKLYHAGDTDFTKEMKALKDENLDIAMMPMGGKYTMDVNDMIQAANVIAAKVTIPMHYKRLLGDAYKEAEEKLKQSVTNSEVVILEELR